MLCVISPKGGQVVLDKVIKKESCQSTSVITIHCICTVMHCLESVSNICGEEQKTSNSVQFILKPKTRTSSEVVRYRVGVAQIKVAVVFTHLVMLKVTSESRVLV